MRIILLGCLIWLTALNAVGQQSSLPIHAKNSVKWPGSCGLPLLGVFRLIDKTNGVASFVEMNVTFRKGENFETVQCDKGKRIELAGWIRTTDDRLFRFVEASLEHDGMGYHKVVARTENMNGVEFQISGEFLDKPKKHGNSYVRLHGAITMFEEGKKIVEHEGDFEKWTSSDVVIN